jgi:hypothetical protein
LIIKSFPAQIEKAKPSHKLSLSFTAFKELCCLGGDIQPPMLVSSTHEQARVANYSTQDLGFVNRFLLGIFRSETEQIAQIAGQCP